MSSNFLDMTGGDSPSSQLPVCGIKTKYPELAGAISVILDGVCNFDGKPDIFISDSDDAPDSLVVYRAGDPNVRETVERPFLPEKIFDAFMRVKAPGGDLFFADKTDNSVNLGNTSVKLTDTEFRLFSVLLESGNEFISSSELSRRVWGREDENLCAVYVSYLRRKLDAAFGDGTVITARGKGYKLRSYQSTERIQL